jgi:hypothetical protein
MVKKSYFSMRKTLFILDLIVVLYAGWQLLQSRNQTKILYIGNSYTFENEMPDIFEHLAISKGKNVFVEACTKGKATFLTQSKRSEVYQSIRRKKWDYVIIQGYSREMLVDAQTMRDTTLPALEKIIRAVKRNSYDTDVLFYMTWGYRNGYKPNKRTNTYDKMTYRIRDQYLMLMEKYQCSVVPVGMAWKDSRYKRSKLDLYVEDGAHPSLEGSYLAACCFYAAIFNESAVGSSYYSSLSPQLSYYLQSVASKNVLYQRKKYGLIRLDN